MQAESSPPIAVGPAEVLRTMFAEQPDRLRRRAVSLGLRHEDAEDAAQAVALTALEHVEELRSADEPAICAWVDTIARRVVIDEYRRRERERSIIGEVGRGAESDPATGARARGVLTVVVESAEAAWEHQSRVRQTALAIQALPDVLREVVELRYGNELPTRRIAEELGLSDTAVRQRLTRARAALAEQVGGAD
ncbi:RNA polymerase sigma factor [Agromyces sp. MMS24-JH15]|uniref:RNA polymerase sigma factor n=1 Tax=Agromyces sp. MMS24-JH15 TaxID=3243765 RepID=UPI003748F8C0